MTLTAGQSLSFYEVLGPLGAGGMGEVYRAKDTRLDREVAIKVLPEELADDEERLRRFEREAKTLASLNHTNIAGIHGIDQVDDTCFLAMELVPGEDLEHRLKRGALPLDEALDVCRQIAEGLEAAHEAGVVHRDLKPANVRITPDGAVKILDFGLAKPVGPQAGSSGPSGAGSDSFLVTEEGLVLGTPTYMSPEQARGKPVDRRTDIWAFGCVLFECLTGKRAFQGDAFGDLIAAILEHEPDLDALPSATPPHLRRLIERCLVKDPRTRLRDIGEARLALEAIQRGDDSIDLVPAPARRSFGWMALLLTLVIGALAGRTLTPSGASELREGDAGSVQLVAEIELPFEFSLRSAQSVIALAPDGTRLALAGRDAEGRAQLLVRDLTSGETHELDFDESGPNQRVLPHAISWSPNGKELCYATGNRLMRLALDGGRPQVITHANVQTASWGADDTILYGTFRSSSLFTVSADGGSVTEVLDFTPNEAGDEIYQADWLPGGERFVFTAESKREADTGGLFLGRVGSSEVEKIASAYSGVDCIAPGIVVYASSGGLYARRIDRETGAVGPESERLVDDVWTDWEASRFSLSADGRRLVYGRAEDTNDVQLGWLDRGTGELEMLDYRGNLWSPMLSPDETRIALDWSTESTAGDIWILDLENRRETRVTSATPDESGPIWSHDAEWLYFRSGSELRRASTRRVSEQEVLYVSERGVFPHGLTPDGKELFFLEYGGGESEVMSLELATGEVRSVLAGGASETAAGLSPDGRWLVYGSVEIGEQELHITDYPDRSIVRQISQGGGATPRWRADSAELFFSSQGRIVSVTVESDPDTTLRIGQQEPVGELPWRRVAIGREFAVTADGQRVLLLMHPEGASSALRLIDGWLPTLETH